jgi:hypothetical protein
MMPLNVIFVPVPVPAGSGGIGWERRHPPPKYPQPHTRPQGWPPAQPIPAQAAREALAAAKRMIAQAREQRALRQNG